LGHSLTNKLSLSNEKPKPAHFKHPSKTHLPILNHRLIPPTREQDDDAAMGKTSGAKQATVVVAAMALGWLAIEIAFKPFLDKFRSSIDKSDPTKDPDDFDTAATATTSKEGL